MNLLIRDMPLFVEVARLKSFTLAAESLGIGISTLSRRISALEREMGVSLFLRNTRNVELTRSGMELFGHCEHILAETDAAYDSVIHNQNAPAGLIRLSIFSDVYHFHLAETLTRFAARWPDIQLHITLNEQPVDLLTEPYDLDIRFGPLPDSTLTARKIHTIHPGLYAAPGLLERYPLPVTPEDLTGLPCIFLTSHGDTWELSSGKQKKRIRVRPAYRVNSIRIWSDFALAGLGVGLLGTGDATFYERNNTLVRILPEWSGPPIDMYIILAGRQLPQRIRLLVDHLAEHGANMSVNGPLSGTHR